MKIFKHHSTSQNMLVLNLLYKWGYFYKLTNTLWKIFASKESRKFPSGQKTFKGHVNLLHVPY